MTRGKRKADNSPLRNDKVKRSALGNLTNNVNDDPKICIKNGVQCNQKVGCFKFKRHQCFGIELLNDELQKDASMYTSRCMFHSLKI